MDFHHNDSISYSWAWEVDDMYLQANSSIEDISYMFEETTPIKSCADDVACHFSDYGFARKTPQADREYASQVKRRRILDFDCDSEEISSSFFKFKERLNVYDAAPLELDNCVQDEFLPCTIDDVGQSEAWLAECLNDTDLNDNSNDGNVSTVSDVQDDVKEVFDIAPVSEKHMLQRPVKSMRKIILKAVKGRKSYVHKPSEACLSIVYPFNFVKPCGVHGDVTLNDINRRIQTPPPLKPKAVEDGTIYPTSAFSGKPVIVKTKIPTQGGKGCITIMRTKG